MYHGADSHGAAALPDGRPLWHAAIDVPNFVQQPRARAVLDVIGGIVFATIVSVMVIRSTTGLFIDGTWASAIGWESVWLIAAILVTPFMASGIIPDNSFKATLLGLKLDWPELLYSLYMLVVVVSIGITGSILGPLGLAFAVGAAEEMIFRVLLLGWLVTRLKPEHALVVSALVFGVGHLQEISLTGLLSVLPQTAGGIVLGAMYLRSRNIASCIIAHAAWDFPIFLAWGLVSGGSVEAGMPSVASLLPWTILAIYGLYLVRHGVDLPGRPAPNTPRGVAGAAMHR
jgi:membrane protease YdiL (CAAX protease family)